MGYRIYEIVKLESKRKLSDYYTKTPSSSCLQELNIEGVQPRHFTADEAMAEIHDQRVKLVGRELTVLPVVRVEGDGTLS